MVCAAAGESEAGSKIKEREEEEEDLRGGPRAEPDRQASMGQARAHRHTT